MKVNSFLIHKCIVACAGSAMKDIKKMAAGLMVETENVQQRMKLLSLKKIGDIDVEVSSYVTLNIMKGEVVCQNLPNCPEEEIVSELASQDVVAC